MHIWGNWWLSRRLKMEDRNWRCLLSTNRQKLWTCSDRTMTKHLITQEPLVKDFMTIRVCSNDQYWKKSIYSLHISNLITKTPVSPGDIHYSIKLNVKVRHHPYFLVSLFVGKLIKWWWTQSQKSHSVPALPKKEVKHCLYSHKHCNIFFSCFSKDTFWAKQTRLWLFSIYILLWISYFNVQALLFPPSSVRAPVSAHTHIQYCMFTHVHRNWVKCPAICCTVSESLG